MTVPTTMTYAEWLKNVSPPPLKISKAKLEQLSKTQEEELRALTDGRKIIDPCRINQFIDPAKEDKA